MRIDKRRNTAVHSGDSKETTKINSGNGAELKQNISESLQAIDADVSQDKTKKQKKRQKKRLFKRLRLAFGLLVLVGAGFLLQKAWHLSARIFQGNLFGIFSQQELKMDEFGRSNVLILGTTDDLRSDGGDGADLTDSMMVLSVDQKNKDAYMFSIPRDLYVDYGQACTSGYQGKINAFFSCIDSGDSDVAEKKRLDGIREFIGDIFDMDIQYVAHINTSVIRDSVDAVGGITVDVQGTNGAPGVYDEIFDQFCREVSTSEERKAICPTGHYLDLKNGPNEMDGRKALAFSQARGSMGGNTAYGLDGSNFAREQNQQRVMIALKEKATSTGTLMDVRKVMGLMEAMGDNLRTNVDVKEVQTIMKLGAEIESDDIHRLSFVDNDNLLMGTGSVGGQSVVQPTAGLYDYSEIRAYLRKTVFATPMSKEGAKVLVLNGGGEVGSAKKQVDKLAKLGILATANDAPEGSFTGYKLYSLKGEDSKPLTRQKLAEVYGVKVSDKKLPFELNEEADFVIIIGSGTDDNS